MIVWVQSYSFRVRGTIVFRRHSERSEERAESKNPPACDEVR